MKKLIAIIATLIIASVAVADTTFKYSIKGNIVSASSTNVEKDKTQSFTDLRVRPKFTATDGTTKVVLQFEIDQTFGEGDNDDKSFADIGADQAGKVEIKSAYVESKVVKAPGLSLTAGIKGYSFPLFVSTDLPLAMLNYEYEKMFKGSLVFIKTSEGDITSADKDASIFGLDLTFKAGDITVHPGVFVAFVGEDALNETQFNDGTGFIGGISVSYAKDKLSANLSFIYGAGKQKSGASTKDYSGMGIDFSVDYEVQKGISVGFFAAYFSGKDDTKSDESTSYSETINMTDGDPGRLYILEDCGSFGNLSNTTSGDITESGDSGYGYWYAGLKGSASVEGFTAFLQVAYAQLAKEPTGGKKDLGVEIDINLSYQISPATNFFVEFAYLATGDAFKTLAGATETDNAMYFASGVSFKL